MTSGRNVLADLFLGRWNVRHGRGNNRERHYARKLANEICDILDSGKWQVMYVTMADNPDVCQEFDLSEDAVGQIDDELGVIYIDFRFDVISTLVHELLHARFWGRPERDILKLEKLVMRYLSAAQARRLHKRSGHLLITPDSPEGRKLAGKTTKKKRAVCVLTWKQRVNAQTALALLKSRSK